MTDGLNKFVLGLASGAAITLSGVWVGSRQSATEIEMHSAMQANPSSRPLNGGAMERNRWEQPENNMKLLNSNQANTEHCSPVDRDGNGWCLRYSPHYQPDMFKLYPPFEPNMSDEGINAIMKTHTWAHTIELKPGLITHGGMEQASWPGFLEAAFPQDMTGKTLIDIGSWDGFFSFYAESHGAAVTSIDYCCWGGSEPGMPVLPGMTSSCCSTGNFDGYRLAHALKRSENKALRLNVYDLHPAFVQPADIVYFAGVLYHLRHPFYALERVASITKSLLIVETHMVDLGQDMSFSGKVSSAFFEFYPGKELANDGTNWFAWNEEAMFGLFRNVGFRSFMKVFQMGPRTVYHAFK